MERDSLITRARGKGSFVARKQTELELMKLTGMMEDIIAMGIKTKTRIINFDFVHPPKKVIANLKLDEDAKVLRVERIRSIKELPVSHSLTYIPSDLGKKLNIRDLTFQPILDVLEKKCKIKIGRGFQIIEATVADSSIASFLDVMMGAPLLKIERTVFDVKNRPLEYISILYRSDRYHYSVQLVRKRSESKARWDYFEVDKKSD